MIVAELNYLSSNIESKDWILDSAASKHMSGSLNHFHNHEVLKNARNVRFGGGNMRQALGVGDVLLQTIVSPGVYQEVIIEGVWYVSHLKRNLISLILMMRRGFAGEITKDMRV